MRANRDVAIGHILDDEGGWAERATEPGGAVNFGVSMTAFMGWRGKQRQPIPSMADLKAMDRSEAVAFYGYIADALGFDGLMSGVDYAALDAAVNEGGEGAKALLLLTKPLTDPKDRIAAISDIRLAVKRRRPEWAKFGPGWSARIGERVPARAIAMMEKA